MYDSCSYSYIYIYIYIHTYIHTYRYINNASGGLHLHRRGPKFLQIKK